MDKLLRGEEEISSDSDSDDEKKVAGKKKTNLKKAAKMKPFVKGASILRGNWVTVNIANKKYCE